MIKTIPSKSHLNRLFIFPNTLSAVNAATALLLASAVITQTATAQDDSQTRAEFAESYVAAPNVQDAHLDIVYDAEQDASEAGVAVLETVRTMALDDREIIQGACWDYLNEAFNRSDVERDTIFKGAYPNGAFIDTALIQPGDWLYYVNHSYNDIQHSGLFIGWIDENQNEALILSYAGQSRNEPARYRMYDVSHTYNVMRPSF